MSGFAKTVLVPLAALVVVAACPRSEESAPKPTAAEEAPPAVELPAASGSAAPGSPRPGAFAERRAERRQMVASQMADRDITDPRVLAAMRTVPRHAFVPAGVAGQAYADRPLPIGDGQTISQPYIVAFMTQAAAPKPTDRCLEIGTGSGYQAAVLAELCAATYSIEYLAPVAKRGADNLRKLGYGSDRVHLRVGDGYVGWPKAAPFDVIIVTAAPDHVPQPLIDQLAVGGRLVIPVGPNSGAQELERWTRKEAGAAEGAVERQRLLGVRFVPFLGDRAKTR